MFHNKSRSFHKPCLLGTHVLAINTYKGNKQAVLVNMAGGFTKLAFSFPSDTDVYNSCSLVFNNKMFVFGGWSVKRQISQVSSCGLVRIGSLDFDFYNGACTIFHSQILLCFDWSQNEGHVCRLAKSPTGLFSKVRSSYYHHYSTKIASNGSKSTISLTL